jgi:diadenylate cyclase
MGFLIPRITDLIDILLVAFLLYRLIVLTKRTGGYQILIGLFLLLILFFIASVLNLRMITSFLGVVKDYWVIVFVIIFHPEIRSLILKLAGDRDLLKMFKTSSKYSYTPLLNAVSIMSYRNIGALIVIEKQRKLTELIDSGEIIDAQISLKLLLTIFNQKTILHDGAVVIRQNRIYAAKVVLPLSENIDYTRKLGTRHLAAVGITEKTDAFVIVVSEETGRISIAKAGELISNLSIDELAQRLKDETS